MADADIYSLFLGAPDAAAQAQAQAEALRRRREGAALARNAGNVALLSGDRVLSAFGNAQLRQGAEGDAEAGRMEGMLAQAGSQGAGRALQEALAQRQQEAVAGQNALQRGLQRDLAGITDARERAKMEAEAARAGAKDAAAQQKAKLDAAESLRKEFYAKPEVKQYNEIAASFDGLKSSINDMTGAGATAVIFNFMKMLDPGVAVMEGDVNLIRNSGGPAARWANIYEEVKLGNKLPAEVRQNLLNRAKGLLETRKQQYGRAAEGFKGLAARQGVPIGDVVLDAVQDAGAGPGATPEAPAATGSMGLNAPQQELTPADQKALDWARKNSTDKRAQDVFKRLGVR